ncbi:MAG TPA: SUMF1/EgtB/PvdO family nonheme iron enzyme [Polyangiaceae bacterium]|jgi:formylglycine-generating enzyme required for sulfatase activity
MGTRARRGAAAAACAGAALAAVCQCGGGNGATAYPDAGGPLACVCEGEQCACPAGKTCATGDQGHVCVPACDAGGACLPSVDAGTGPGDAGRDAPAEVGPPVCTVGAQRCTGDDRAVETCNALGQWSAPWPCTTGVCSGAACGGTTTTATSCAGTGPGLSDCGAAGESCCTSVELPGGLFYRTYEADGGGASGLADSATVSGFRLDVYDVTVARFRRFVAALGASPPWAPKAGDGKHVHLHAGNGLGDSSHPGQFESGWDTGFASDVNPLGVNLACSFHTPPAYTWTDAPGANEDKPITCVDWYEAYAFCIWDGGFLPSETEWEYAAAAADQQREYPWGSDELDGSTAYAIYGGNYDGGGGAGAIFAPVGTAVLGAGLWGQLDLAGEVWQWTLDEEAKYVNPCHDCAYLAGAPDRVYRGGGMGGSLTSDASAASFVPSFRQSNPGTLRNNIGIRCARTP